MLFGMRKSPPLAVLLFLCATPLAAQLADSDAQTKSACESYLKTPLPPEASLVATPKKWPECNSYKLYSGIGTKVDFQAARKCAWSERLAQQAGLEPRFTAASVFGGSAMLAVIYANGNAVPQDIPLAKRLVCEASGAPAEIHIRLEHLDEIKSKSASSQPFKFCDDITSGFMEGFCAAYQSELADGKRTETLQALAMRLSQGQREAFDQLTKSEQAYALAHAKGEIDLSGTARAMYQIDAEDTLRDDFIAALQSFEAGRFPKGSVPSYRDADTKLNVVYRQSIANAEEHKNEYGAIQPEGIRDTERAWLKYRDAWVTFAKLRYPSVGPEAWLILLTKDRTSILDGSFCDMDAMDGPCAQKGDTWKPSPLP
jgi:uncharacterized protein YecT (DUF1311 family)